MYRLQRSRQRVISVVSSGSFYKCCCLYTVISVVFPSAHWFMWKTNLQLVKTWSFHSDGGRLVALPSNRAVPNSFHLCFWFFFFFLINKFLWRFLFHLLFATEKSKRVRDAAVSPLTARFISPHRAATTSVVTPGSLHYRPNRGLEVHTSLHSLFYLVFLVFMEL